MNRSLHSGTQTFTVIYTSSLYPQWAITYYRSVYVTRTDSFRI